MRVTDDATQAVVYAGLVRAAACDPQIAEVNIFGFYDDVPRDTGFQAALNHVDGTPRASADAVQARDRGVGGGMCRAPSLVVPGQARRSAPSRPPGRSRTAG